MIEQGGLEKTLQGSHLLVAAGRTPNTEGIGLELAGVELTDRGYIKVNERLATNAPGVWTIGEVAGSPQFTHVSVDDFRVVHDGITGGKRVTTGRLLRYCMFTDPELAHIGLSEKQAKERGIACRLFKIPMGAIMHATTLSETRGFLKALVEVNTDRILGFTGFGRRRGGNLVFRANCNPGRPAVYRAARRDTNSPDPRRRTYPTILLRTFDTQGFGNDTSLCVKKRSPRIGWLHSRTGSSRWL